MEEKKYQNDLELIKEMRDGTIRITDYLVSIVNITEDLYINRSIFATALKLIAENVGTEFEVKNETPDNFSVVVHCYPKEGDSDPTKWIVKLNVIYPELSQIVSKKEEE